MLNSVNTWVNLQDWQLSRQLTVLAVSGGKDSMALFYLFHKMNWPFVVAHVNYGLRDNASDSDEQLVREICEKFQIPFYHIAPDTLGLAQSEGTSIQMAARKIRYAFFESVREKVGATYIATAHHAYDHFENFFIYLSRNQINTAFKGIPAEQGSIIRPLLSVTPLQISDFIEELNIPWRQDETNFTTKYLRNKIRWGIVYPLLVESPELLQQFFEISRLTQSSDHSLSEKSDLWWQQFTQYRFFEGTEQSMIELIEISADGLKTNLGETMFKKQLQRFGFNKSQMASMIQSKLTGSVWLSGEWKLYKERFGFSLVKGKRFLDLERMVNPLDSDQTVEFGFYQFNIESCISPDELILPSHKSTNNEIAFDSNQIEWPLIIRLPKLGDKVVLKSGNGSKLVSDILTDHKVPAWRKPFLPVIADKKGVLAIPGVYVGGRAKIFGEGSGFCIHFSISERMS